MDINFPCESLGKWYITLFLAILSYKMAIKRCFWASFRHQIYPKYGLIQPFFGYYWPLYGYKWPYLAKFAINTLIQYIYYEVHIQLKKLYILQSMSLLGLQTIIRTTIYSSQLYKSYITPIELYRIYSIHLTMLSIITYKHKLL